MENMQRECSADNTTNSIPINKNYLQNNRNRRLTSFQGNPLIKSTNL